MNCQPKDVVRNEPRGVRRFEHKRLREPMCWVLVRLRVQIEVLFKVFFFKVEQNFDKIDLIIVTLSWPRTLMRIPPSNMGWQSTAVMR